MTERYSYFLRLRGQPKRIKTRVSREAYILSRQQKRETLDTQPAWEALPAISAIGPASDF
jgi:hypothetical protein